MTATLSASMISRETQEEAQLVSRAQNGDNAAFDALVERYRTTLYRQMVRACHHPEDAEEVASEAFARAYEKLQQFEGRSQFVSWLGTIANNLCIRRRTKPAVVTQSINEVVGGEESTFDEAAVEYSSPEVQALRSEMRATIRRCVAQLPPAEQEVLRLRDIEDIPGDEVARQLSLSLPAMKSRLHRARQHLREALETSL